MLKKLYLASMLLIFHTPVQASLPNEELVVEMRSVAYTGPGIAPMPERARRPKVIYLRRCVPFLLSGSAAVAELALTERTTNPVILAATVLWLGSNIAGLFNIYIDYRFG